MNIARGSLRVDADLLARAPLDACRDEPLPATHPFWHHPRITITPHTSAATRVEASVAQVAAKLRRLVAGFPVGGRVDRNQGY